MLAHLRQGTPTITLFNHLEAYGSFLRRGDESHLLQNWGMHGDRSLFWAGDPKLTFVSTPIPGAELLCQRWGYSGTRTLAPQHPTTNLAFDILAEPPLLQALLEHAGREKTIQILPFCTTPVIHQFANILRNEYKLKVLLPESPTVENLWLRDYIDTKSGFRELILQWLGEPALLPFGFICQKKEEARDAVLNFLRRGKGCVLKSDIGVSGLGHQIFRPNEKWFSESILDAIVKNEFLRDELLVVDELIPTANQLSPSLEMFVPPAGSGTPQITHLARQLLTDFGSFAGALISRELLDAPWYPSLKKVGLAIARNLQELGYVGHFDLDAIISDDGKMCLMEVNSRRTGSTYVHELAQFILGDDYLAESILLTNHKISCPGITDPEHLLQTIDDLLFPIAAGGCGAVVTTTSHISEGSFGAVFIGRSTQEVLEIKGKVENRFSS
jgi:hypothetical protein